MDAFGHSATSARIFEELGFEAFFFSRMNDTQKHEFKQYIDENLENQESTPPLEEYFKNHDMQFLWRPVFEG
jgi:hypothetical protein